MKLVLAALDASTLSQTVLDTAIGIGEMTGTEVEAVHVTDGGTEPLDPLARRAGVPLRRLTGPVERALLGAMDAPKVLAAVIGVGATDRSRRPVGSTARYVLEHATKPVVVVPPDAVASGPLRRLLVPLEGTETSSRPVLDALCPLLVAGVELVVLHVFTEKTLPRMLDRPHRDLELLGQEFLATHLPTATRIELRPGPVMARMAEVAEEHGADLIVLSWSQNSARGRARIVREVLGASTLPVLLLPIGPPADITAVPRTGPTVASD